jgi:formylglycine-generating enzyme required for sulfatase activity
MIAGCGLLNLPFESGDQNLRAKDGMPMVHVPAGSFMMGSLPTDGTNNIGIPYPNEFPQHEVSVDAFWLDKLEVSNAQYQICVDEMACLPPRDLGSNTRKIYFGDAAFDDYPVINLSWYQAVAYCTWAGGRLPNEAEWAFAARSPESYLFPWGNEFDGHLLNYCDINCSLVHADQEHTGGFNDGYTDTSPVGYYPEGGSWVGALDLQGNVWEWVWDWHALYEGHEWLEHPHSYPPETFRVLRGGAWDTARGHARAAFRNWYLPAEHKDSIGFRCAMDVEAKD